MKEINVMTYGNLKEDYRQLKNYLLAPDSKSEKISIDDNALYIFEKDSTDKIIKVFYIVKNDGKYWYSTITCNNGIKFYHFKNFYFFLTSNELYAFSESDDTGFKLLIKDVDVTKCSFNCSYGSYPTPSFSVRPCIKEYEVVEIIGYNKSIPIFVAYFSDIGCLSNLYLIDVIDRGNDGSFICRGKNGSTIIVIRGRKVLFISIGGTNCYIKKFSLAIYGNKIFSFYVVEEFGSIRLFYPDGKPFDINK